MTKHEEVTTADETGLDALDPATTPARSAEHHRRIVAAVEGVDNARAELDAAVAAAREAGDSWTIIGAALGVTKQAASERFGGRVRDFSGSVKGRVRPVTAGTYRGRYKKRAPKKQP